MDELGDPLGEVYALPGGYPRQRNPHWTVRLTVTPRLTGDVDQETLKLDCIDEVFARLDHLLIRLKSPFNADNLPWPELVKLAKIPANFLHTPSVPIQLEKRSEHQVFSSFAAPRKGRKRVGVISMD